MSKYGRKRLATIDMSLLFFLFHQFKVVPFQWPDVLNIIYFSENQTHSKGTLAKVIFYFVWLSRYVLGSVATVMHKLFGYNYIMMPLCAALLMVQVIGSDLTVVSIRDIFVDHKNAVTVTDPRQKGDLCLIPTRYH